MLPVSLLLQPQLQPVVLGNNAGLYFAFFWQQLTGKTSLGGHECSAAQEEEKQTDEFGFGSSKMILWRFAAAQGKPLFAYVQLLHVLCVPVVASEMKTGKLTGIYLWDGVANVAYARKKKSNGLSLLLTFFPRGAVAAVPEMDSSIAHGFLLPACAQKPLSKALHDAALSLPCRGRG